MLVIVLLYVRRIFFISLCVPVLSVFFSRCFFLSFLLFLLTFLRCISRSLFHCPSFFFFWYFTFKSFLFSLVSLKKKKKSLKLFSKEWAEERRLVSQSTEIFPIWIVIWEDGKEGSLMDCFQSHSVSVYSIYVHGNDWNWIP